MTATDRPDGNAPAQADDDVQQNSNLKLSGLFASEYNGNNGDGEQGIRKQSSLLHQSSSYLKQATSGFMRWQSRRAFWSAVDRPETERRSTRVACANTRLAFAYWFKTVGHVARRHPSVILVPLLFGCACLAGGLAGVILASKSAENSRRTDAAATARQAADVLALLVEDRALLPAAALASLAAEQPNVTALAEALPRLQAGLLGPQSTAQSSSATPPLRGLLLAPFGFVRTVLAPDGSAGATPGGTPGTNLRTTTASSQATALLSKARTPVAAVALIRQEPGLSGGSSEVLLLTHRSVYAPAAAATETWGNTGPEVAAGDCGAACYDPSSRTKLWGFTVSAVSLSSLFASAEADLSSLTEKHYQYRLVVRWGGSGGGSGQEEVEVAASPRRPPSLRSAITATVSLTGTSAAAPEVAAVAASPGAAAELSVYNSEGWQPVWEGPLIAVVVVVSIALSAMLFVMLFGYWRHMTILKAMLPDKVIDVLSRGAHYYEHFDCVTVLYADVVRYTTATVQQGDSVPTYEVVKLLNDVHRMYASIIEKYGLVSIRRSGESFMCVGGCPTPDDPVAVAVRVAACARDLVMATARFRGSGGFRVQIRVGLHTGPVVAAAVGSKTPRFSLFGDVVDVAYFMEATSRAMAIHVSDVTSQLLVTATDPLLQLRRRGKLDIIGLGAMHTNWLQMDALPDPDPEPAPADGEERATLIGAQEGKRKGEEAAT